MREPTYFILAALQDQPLHGYAIMIKAEELSQGRVSLATGTLYAALDRLAGEGLLAVVDEQVVNGRARRYYALTETGLLALRAEAAKMADAARVVTDLAAVSRSVLDERFRQVLGRSPIRYLTDWRMHQAEELLATTELSVAAVGRRVGYDSEEAFSRAFKRDHTQSSGAWRQSRRRQLDLPRIAPYPR